MTPFDLEGSGLYASPVSPERRDEISIRLASDWNITKAKGYRTWMPKACGIQSSIREVALPGDRCRQTLRRRKEGMGG